MIAEQWNLPLAPQIQSFGLVLAGCEYRLTLRWLEAEEGGWVVDFQEPDKAEPILLGLPLVAGCDLLFPFAYQAYGGGLRLSSELPAGPDTLGTEVRLLFGAGMEEDFSALIAARDAAKADRHGEIMRDYAVCGFRARTAFEVRAAEVAREQEEHDQAMLALCADLLPLLDEMRGCTLMGELPEA